MGFAIPDASKEIQGDPRRSKEIQGDPRTLKYFNGESAVRGKPVVTGTEARLVFRSLFSLIMNRKPERRWRIIAR